MTAPAAAANRAMAAQAQQREQLLTLSKEELIQQLMEANRGQGSSSKALKPKATPRTLNFHQNPTRKIALLFVYQGWHYSGLAIQAGTTPLPTVEGELLNALEKTHLIEHGAGWEGCQFSRCGRTDRGVSSAGQVVTLWVKSRRRRDDGGAPLGDDYRDPRMPKEEPAKEADVDIDANHKQKVASSDAASTPEPSEDTSSAMPLLDDAARNRLLESFKQVKSREQRIAWQIENGVPSNILNKTQKKEYRQDPSRGEAIHMEAMRNFLEGRSDNSKRARKHTTRRNMYATEATAGEPPVELGYVQMLNRVLPPSIRILGWAPVDAQFDARFSCLTRHYRYFFSTRPIPHQPALDLKRMQAAADRLVGEHDFRNFCKLDGSKQIENHCRTVIKASIRRATDKNGSGTYISPTTRDPALRHDHEWQDQQPLVDEQCVFELVGSAFLWHQVRHIMAVLFMVGHGLEDPSIVTSMLNVGAQSQTAPVIAQDAADQPMLDLRIPNPDPLDCDSEPMPTKPTYMMAAALPLQLYECSYAEGATPWRYGPYDGPAPSAGDRVDEASAAVHRVGWPATAAEGHAGLLANLKGQLNEINTKARQLEAFYERALQVTSQFASHDVVSGDDSSTMITHTLGANEVQSARKYVPLMGRPRGETVEATNRKYREGAGARKKAARGGEPKDQEQQQETGRVEDGEAASID